MNYIQINNWCKLLKVDIFIVDNIFSQADQVANIQLGFTYLKTTCILTKFFLKSSASNGKCISKWETSQIRTGWFLTSKGTIKCDIVRKWMISYDKYRIFALYNFQQIKSMFFFSILSSHCFGFNKYQTVKE